MSMAISRVSANTVAAMLYPVMKPSRVQRVGPGRSNPLASSQAVQGTSSTQPTDTSSPEQVHAAFQSALAALSSGGTAGASGTATTQPGTEGQSGGVQQGVGYAQVEQEAGQTLDLTA